jgi:hypothetical protein
VAFVFFTEQFDANKNLSVARCCDPGGFVFVYFQSRSGLGSREKASQRPSDYEKTEGVGLVSSYQKRCERGA